MLVKERIWTRIKNFKIPYMEDSEKDKLEKCLKEAIKKDDGNVVVDWKKVLWLNDNTKSEGYSRLLRDGMWSRLVDENVLSRESEGNFYLLDGNLIRNPPDDLPDHRAYDWLYFTREEDAEAYRDAKFGKTPYIPDVVKLH
jgi:hypothetical protein